MTPPPIPNKRLKLKHIPPRGTRWDWPGLQAFALTFDGYAHGLEFGADPHLEREWDGYTLSDMRAALFLAQRNWNHADHTPTERELASIERLIQAIRERVEASSTSDAEPWESLDAALRNFEARFANWEIALPPGDVRLRRAGFLQVHGWLIQYQFGRSGKTEYLDYYASHHMAGDEHVRLYASGGRRRLATIAWSYFTSDDPVEALKRERAFFRRNRRVARVLIAKGFNKATMNDVLATGPLDAADDDVGVRPT